MTWHLDPETGDVYNDEGNVVGNAGDGPYTLPDSLYPVLVDSVLPDDNAAVRGEHLKAVLAVTAGDIEYGTP